jgi:hypothetical protein
MKTPAVVAITIKVFDGVICLPQKWAAKFLDVTPQRFRQFNIEPHARVSRAPWYSLLDLAAFRAERSATSPKAADDVNANDRLKNLRADQIEFELARERGEYERISSLQSAADAACSAVSARLDALPHAIAAELMAARDVSEVARMIRAALYRAIEPLSEISFAVGGAGMPIATASRADDKRTGSGGGGVGGSKPHSVA